MLEELTHFQTLLLGMLVGGTWAATVVIAFLAGQGNTERKDSDHDAV